MDFFFPSIHCKCWSTWHCSWEPHFSGSLISPLTVLSQSDSSLIDKQYFLSRCLPVVTGFMTAIHSYCGFYIYIMDLLLLAQTGFQEWEMENGHPASQLYLHNERSRRDHGNEWNFIMFPCMENSEISFKGQNNPFSQQGMQMTSSYMQISSRSGKYKQKTTVI